MSRGLNALFSTVLVNYANTVADVNQQEVEELNLEELYKNMCKALLNEKSATAIIGAADRRLNAEPRNRAAMQPVYDRLETAKA